ncbi:MAG TPA: alpha/beta hydrolase [Alphaproteobacteria bacterium]|nr:alpha/beta hydrolase [Alphaproteobacteria bacterium]
MAEYIRKSIKFNNTNIVYFVKGNSHEAVCYCHGDGQNHTAGRFYLELFPDTYKKIAVDLPGHGYSSDFENRTLDTEVSVLNAIMDAEKIKSPLIIGHSHGGTLGIAYASKHPVKGLILFDPLFKDPKEVFGKNQIENLEARYLSMVHGKFDANAAYYIYGNEKSEENVLHAAIIHTPYDTIAKNLNVYQGYDSSMNIKKFNFPVLVLQSENTFMPSFKEHVIHSVMSMPLSKIEIIKLGTHNMPLLMKEQLAEKILQNFHFLRV